MAFEVLIQVKGPAQINAVQAFDVPEDVELRFLIDDTGDKLKSAYAQCYEKVQDMVGAARRAVMIDNDSDMDD